MNSRVFMLLSLSWACAANAQGPTNGVAPVTAVEAEMAAGALVQENEALRSDVALLREQVTRLTVSLAESLAELDVERSRETAGAGAEDGTGLVRDNALDLSELRVVDANPALNMIVISGGAAKGVKPGLKFAVVRDRTALARVRTVDVREKIAGAVIEQWDGKQFPEKGDRVILAR